jgi:UDP-glucose 4-epimerase
VDKILNCYLVSGGAGFIGSHFVDYLLSLNETKKVVVIDNFYLGNFKNLNNLKNDPRIEIVRADASNLPTMLDICENYKPQIYINFAVVPLPTSLQHPAWTVKTNIDLAITACELTRMEKVSKYVQISTSEIYGTAKYVPMDENHPINSETPYAASKAAADQITLSYMNTFGIKASILRPFNNYGPRQNQLEYAGVIPRFIQNMLGQKDCVVYGDGFQTRDFIYVEDTVKYIMACISSEKCWDYGPINICSGEEISIVEIFNTLKKIMNSKSSIIFSPSRAGDVLRHCGGSELLVKLTGLKPPKGMNTAGLEKTIASYT